MDMNCSCTLPAELEGRRSLGRYDVISGVGEGRGAESGLLGRLGSLGEEMERAIRLLR